jgi:hypothetical protein
MRRVVKKLTRHNRGFFPQHFADGWREYGDAAGGLPSGDLPKWHSFGLPQRV